VRQGLSRPFWLALVTLAFCAPLFVGLGRTDMENDEAIYSFAVDRILQTGDWLNPPLSPSDTTTFLEKPPLKFWIVAGPMFLGLAPRNEVGMRVWDALFGAVAFLYVFAMGRRLSGPICGAIAVLVLFVYRPLLFEHGLRNNNMEAALVLCYCGAMYHYLAWTSQESGPRRRAHVAAVWAYFFLGFMTKFVASFFLPMVLGLLTLTETRARRRLFEDLPTWLLGGVAFLAAAAPWFIYESFREGSGFWRVLVGEHVYQRFTSSLDTGHIKPWTFYFVQVFRELQHSGTAWLAIAGGLLLAVRVVRDKTMEPRLVIAWFTLPLTLMSFGTSKLHHYLYPFLAPAALAAGYTAAWVVQSGRVYVDAAMAWVHERLGTVHSWGSGVRHLFLALAAVAILIAAATLAFGPFDWHVGGVRIFRNSHVARPLFVALVFATLAGRGAFAARVLWPVALVLAVVPVNAYEDTLRETTVQRHPLRAARDCLVQVRERELAAGRPAPGVYAVGEHEWFLHSYFYYLHHVGGWERAAGFEEPAIADALFTGGKQRPTLLTETHYRAIKARDPERLARVAMVPLSHVLLLMPGPYARCGPVVSPSLTQ
jgi:4-amino-4-deoxy-L-arabinose transferase-like glycosyltransferase